MSDSLPLNGLKAFEAAARHLSFSKAAEELHVTPAAISQQVRSLEDQLGVKLFHRGNRSLALTASATAGLEPLRDGFTLLTQSVGRMRHREQRPTLTVWAAPSFASHWLLSRLPRFHDIARTRRDGNADMNFAAITDLIGEAGAPQQLGERLRRQRVDVAIHFGALDGSYPDCRVDKLLDAEAVTLCSPALMRDRPLRTPADLNRHTLLHDDTGYQGNPDWRHWLDAVGERAVDADRGVRFNHVSLALQAAVDGQGVALSLLALAQTDIDAGRLLMPFEMRLPLAYAYYIVSPSDVAGRPEVGAFRDWLLNEADRDAAAHRYPVQSVV